MSLIGTLNIGKTALAVQQAAIQVTGNNIANAGNADYTRQAAGVVPGADQQIRPGMFVGTGINLSSISRQIDDALEGRLRGAIADGESANTTQQWIGRIESIFNELGEDDLSTQFSAFFNSWSNLANKPQDIGLRQVVVQSGQTLASWLQNVRTQLAGLQDDVDNRMAGLATDANQLAQQVADLNQQIVVAEGGAGGQANGLRDQRDAVLKKLAELMNITTVDTGNGMVNVMVGSEPLVIGTTNRGVIFKQATGASAGTIAFAQDNGTMRLTSGQLGALTGVRGEIDGAIGKIDELAGNLIFELNKVYSSGQGLEGFSQVTAANSVDDTAVPLNTPAAGLPFTPTNGSFVIQVRQKATGLVTSTLVNVDLDGLNGNDTTLAQLRDQINAVPNISATITAGKLQITADSADVDFSFAEDHGGTLAALGINAFFTGSSARDIAVNATLDESPALLAAARNSESGDNQTARLIAGLESQPISALGGTSLKDRYQAMVNGIAVRASSARTNADAARVLKETLQAQRESLSGVSLDEEAINLIRQQRAFQGAARLISVIDEMMQTVLQLV